MIFNYIYKNILNDVIISSTKLSNIINKLNNILCIKDQNK